MIAHNPAGSQIAGGVTPADYAFRKVAERRFVLDAELPYDGAFLPAARYEIDVKGPGASIDFAERATGRRILSVPAPATVAPPFSFSLILTGLGRIATYVRKDGRVTLDRTLACPDGFNPRLRVNLGNAVSNARVTLSAGIGQADVRFVTEGRSHAPYVEDDRYYFTFSARSFGSYLGVASFTPEAFDVRFEGVILFDYGDGELRNDVAADLFHDTATGEWRAFVSNFSTGGDALSGRAKGGINVAWCTTSPLHGFSVMSAKSLDLEGMNEDPDGYYDAEAGMWRLFVSEFTPGRIRAALLESEHWDGTYRRIAGPVAEDSTGTTLVRCGGKTWAIFGSADRACYVRTYPDLEPVGHLSFDHPPWPAGKSDNWAEGRVWPAFAETPGGAIHASGGSLDIFGSRFTNNFFSATADNVWFDGAALYASAVALTIADTVFDGNTLSDTIKPCQGAALFLTGGNAFIDGCTFTTNTLYGNHNGNDHTGAAIHATGVTGLTVRDSYFAGNVSKCNTQKSGGLVRLSGATEATTMRLERCVFKANGPTDDNLGMCASIGLNAGILEMEHCLFAELSLPRSGSFKRAIDIQKGTLRASKCSFVNNDAAGIFCHAEQGHVVLTDSIVYGNTQGDLVNFNTDGSNFKVSHCCLGTDYGYGWTGIVTDDPLLSDDGFYHPLSAAGRLADGYLAGSTWTTDAASSPTLDAGDPAADWFDEPQPNNLRMNLGYDANTPAASKSATGAYVAFDSLAVVALAATNVTDSSAWARGIVGGLGNGGDASVTLVWDTADRSTDTAAWAHVVPLGTFGQWGHIASQITGLTGGMTCHYRLVASNASGTAWSDDASFAIPVAPTLALSGISHLSRHSARVCATLVDDGAADCETVVTYWKEAAPSATLSVTLDARQLPEGVLTRIPLGGLTAGTCYGFRVEVSNPAGTATQTGAFTTLATDAPIARYVTPEGAGIQDGSSWENAYAGLLPALDECLYAGDTIYMKHGTYDHFRIYSSGEMSQIILSNLAGLSIYGGYEGGGAPGGLSDEPTVIARNASNNKRHLNAANSRLHFQNITFSDGCWRTGSVGGGSLYLSGCTTAMTNCVFAGNKVNYTAGGGNSIADGGAIYASGGSLDLYGCVFTNNANFISAECRTHGGAISAENCGLAAKKCLFVGNYAYDTQGHVSGGALYIHGASRADVKECDFISNRCIGTGTARVLSLGGALAVRNVRSFTMSDSRFTGNFAASTTGRGGSAFFDGNATMTAVVTRCVFDLNGSNLVAGVTDKPELGSVHLDSASLFMTNCLFARTAKMAAITSENVTAFKDINNGAGYSAARKLELVNVTIADSAGAGIAIVGDADVRVRNAVVWGNAGGGLPTDLTEVAYTCSQEAQNGVGNFSADPLLAPAPYYHLVSRGKYIADGWFGGTFAGPRSRASSPCIDAGDPAFDFAAEPKSRGDAINIGAYGGTPWASTTWFPPGTILTVR